MCRHCLQVEYALQKKLLHKEIDIKIEFLDPENTDKTFYLALISELLPEKLRKTLFFEMAAAFRNVRHLEIAY